MPQYSHRDLIRGVHIAKAAAPFCQIHLTWEQVAVIVAQVQLALRHPANQGLSANEARRFVEGVIDSIEQISPLLANCLRQGWDTSLDSR